MRHHRGGPPLLPACVEVEEGRAEERLRCVENRAGLASQAARSSRALFGWGGSTYRRKGRGQEHGRNHGDDLHRGAIAGRRERDPPLLLRDRLQVRAVFLRDEVEYLCLG